MKMIIFYKNVLSCQVKKLKRGGIVNERKRVMITGASSGIGYEFSKIFAKNDYDLVLVARSSEQLQRIANEISSKYSVAVKVIAKDLSKVNSADEIYFEVVKDLGNIDILINNAGIQVYGSFSETNIEEELRLINVNLITLTKLTKLFLKDMTKRGKGKILNVGSTGSFAPGPLNAVYCATKAYVLSFSEAIAEELSGSCVTITTLCPGATKTEFAKRANIENVRLFRSRVMEASEVADIGFRALMKGSITVIAGINNKLTTFSIRMTPRRIVTKISHYLMSKLT